MPSERVAELAKALMAEWEGFDGKSDLVEYLREIATLTVQVVTDPEIHDREAALAHLKAQVGAIAGIYAARVDQKAIATLKQIVGTAARWALAGR